MLFSNTIRTFTGHRKRSTSIYQFLNQSAWSICELLRGYLTDWAKDFDEDREFISRFTSMDMKQHYSAEFELLLYTILKNQGFAIEKHPDLGTLKRPDFKVVSRTGISSILECTLAGDSFDSLSDQNLKATIEEIIDDIENYPYYINIIFNTLSKTSISKKRVLAFLESVRQKSEGVPNELLVDINHPFEDNGWQLEFSMVRKPEPIRKRSLGFIVNHAKSINTSKPLITSLNDKKPSKYGIIQQPYVICVNTSDQFSSEESLSEALFGQYANDYVYLDRIFTDGFFLNKERHNTTISAVLFFRYFGSYILDKSQCSLWHNPYAQFPMPPNILPFDEFIFNTKEDRLERQIVKKDTDVLDLLRMDRERYIFCKEERPLE